MTSGTYIFPVLALPATRCGHCKWHYHIFSSAAKLRNAIRVECPKRVVNSKTISREIARASREIKVRASETKRPPFDTILPNNKIDMKIREEWGAFEDALLCAFSVKSTLGIMLELRMLIVSTMGKAWKRPVISNMFHLAFLLALQNFNYRNLPINYSNDNPALREIYGA